MDPFAALASLPDLIADYKATCAELIETKRELEKVRSEQYVDIQWVAEYWSVTIDTAKDMITALTAGRGKAFEIKTLRYGQRVVRYRKSDIDRISVASLVSERDRIAQKRLNRQS